MGNDLVASSNSAGEVALSSEEVARGLVQRLTPIADGAGAVVTTVRGIAAMFTIAGVALWVLIAIGFSLLTGWKMIMALVLGLILLIPGIVWILVSIGIGQIAGLPDRLMLVAGQGREHVQASITQIRTQETNRFSKKVFGVLRSIVSARGSLMESKMLVAESVAIVRLFNPFTLAVAGVTFGIGALTVVIVLIAGTLFS